MNTSVFVSKWVHHNGCFETRKMKSLNHAIWGVQVWSFPNMVHVDSFFLKHFR